MLVDAFTREGRRPKIETVVAEQMKIDRERVRVWVTWHPTRRSSRSMDVGVQDMSEQEKVDLRSALRTLVPPAMRYLLR